MDIRLEELIKRLYFAKHIATVQNILQERYNIKLTQKEIKKIATGR